MKNIEAEKDELVLQNESGTYAIIPANKREEVKRLLSEGCYDCIDRIVESLPKASDYAEDGSLFPGWDKVKSTLNPYNWGVKDYTDKGDFDSAYSSARKAGERQFMWNNKRYSTNYKGTPQQQLKESGITDERLQGSSELRKRIANNINPHGYGHTRSAIKAILNDTPEVPIPDDEVEGWLPTDKQDSIYRADSDNLFGYYSPIDKVRGYRPAHEDALSLTMGLPQKYKSFNVSKYKPTISKNKNQIYYSLNNYDAETNILNRALNADFEGKVSKQFAADDAENWTESESAMGNYTISKGEDDRGKYVSYYDINDYAPFGGYGTEENANSITSPLGKPFEIYNRIYYRDYNGTNKRMHYSDDELSKLNPNTKNFDTKALQLELINRGVSLPNSIKYKLNISHHNIDTKLGEKYKSKILNEGEGGITVTVTKNELEEHRRELHEEAVKSVLYHKNNPFRHSKYASFEEFANDYKNADKSKLKSQWDRETELMNMSDSEYLKREGLDNPDEFDIYEQKIVDGVYGYETKQALIDWQTVNKTKPTKADGNLNRILEDETKSALLDYQSKNNKIKAADGLVIEPTNDLTSKLLNKIGELEGRGQYDIMYGGKRNPDLLNMTLGEVINYQQGMKGSSAVGKYQFINKTLDDLINQGYITADTKFTPETQDMLATKLLERRGLNKYLRGELTSNEFADNLSKEWAALPYNTNKSYYDKDGINKSLISREDFMSLFADVLNKDIAKQEEMQEQPASKLPVISLQEDDLSDYGIKNDVLQPITQDTMQKLLNPTELVTEIAEPSQLSIPDEVKSGLMSMLIQMKYISPGEKLTTDTLKMFVYENLQNLGNFPTDDQSLALITTELNK